MIINGKEYGLKFNQLTLEKVQKRASVEDFTDIQATYVIIQAALESAAWIAGTEAPTLEQTVDAVDALPVAERAVFVEQFTGMTAYKELLSSQMPVVPANEKKTNRRNPTK